MKKGPTELPDKWILVIKGESLVFKRNPKSNIVKWHLDNKKNRGLKNISYANILHRN